MFAPAASEELAENVPKASCACAAGVFSAALLVHVFREIEATESHAGIRLPRSARRSAGRNMIRIEAVLIVHLALFGVAQDIVGFLDLLKTLLSRFVARIQIGMILARQLAIRLANFVFFGVPRHAKNFVIILFG